MSNKKNKTETPVVNNEENKDVKTEEPKVPEVKTETPVKLKILIAFSDKYTNADYNVGEVISFKKARAKELLDDYRKLVEVILDD